MKLHSLLTVVVCVVALASATGKRLREGEQGRLLVGEPACKDVTPAPCNMGDKECSAACKCGTTAEVCGPGNPKKFCCGTGCGGATKGCIDSALPASDSAQQTTSTDSSVCDETIGGKNLIVVDMEFVDAAALTAFKDGKDGKPSLMEEMKTEMKNKKKYEFEKTGDTTMRIWEVYADKAQEDKHAIEMPFKLYSALKGSPFPKTDTSPKYYVDKPDTIELKANPPRLEQEVIDRLAEFGYGNGVPYPFKTYPLVNKWVCGVHERKEGGKYNDAMPAMPTTFASATKKEATKTPPTQTPPTGSKTPQTPPQKSVLDKVSGFVSGMFGGKGKPANAPQQKPGGDKQPPVDDSVGDT